MELERTIEEFILREFMTHNPGIRLAYDRPLLRDEILDSLGVLMLVGFLEDRFGVEIDPAEVTVDRFQTIESITALVRSKMS